MTYEKFAIARAGKEIEFSATVEGRRYTAYGDFCSETYAVAHGPTQADVDVISALLDAGIRPCWIAN